MIPVATRVIRTADSVLPVGKANASGTVSSLVFWNSANTCAKCSAWVLAWPRNVVMLRRKLVGSPLLARAPASNRSASSMFARAMPDT